MNESATFSGVVRAIDLDARRFEVRHVQEFNGGSIRCIYSRDALSDEKAILGMRVRVHGKYDASSGAPRLAQVVGVEVVARDSLLGEVEGQHNLLTGEFE